MSELSKDYEVGYCKPPKEHQFQKGQSGNPKGRPKSRKPDTIDISELLNEPVRVRTGEVAKRMSPFEVSTRNLANRALEGDLGAIKKFIKLCEEYRVVAQPPLDEQGGVIQAPRGVDLHEWLESVTEVVPIDET